MRPMRCRIWVPRQRCSGFDASKKRGRKRRSHCKAPQYSPLDTRAWTELAMMYRTDSRTEEAEQVLADLVHVNPTSEAYNAAARVWTTFGDWHRAATLRAEAVRLGALPARPLPAIGAA